MSKLNQLLNQEVTRKQFLVLLGAGVVSLFGLSSLMGLLTENETPRLTGKSYGGGTYGN